MESRERKELLENFLAQKCLLTTLSTFTFDIIFHTIELVCDFR
jgi:hypothetical protein